MPYATKAMAAAITPLMVALIKYLTTGDLPPLEQGITIASAVVGALLVYLVPNLGRGLSGKLKAVVAAAVPLVQLVLLGVSTRSGDASELVALLDALFMALAVYALPNRDPDAGIGNPAPGGARHRNLGSSSSGRSSIVDASIDAANISSGSVGGGTIDPDCGGRGFSSPSNDGGSDYGSGHGSGEGGSGSSAGGYSGDGGGSSGGGDGGGGGSF